MDDFEVDERSIRKAVLSRKIPFKIREDWHTPSGKLRSSPVYMTVIENAYIGKKREIKAQSEGELHQKAREQLGKWQELEIKARVREAKEKATADAESYWEEQAEAAKATIGAIRSILRDGVTGEQVLDLDQYYDTREHPAFSFDVKPPARPHDPPKPQAPRGTLLTLLVPPVRRRKLAQYEAAVLKWERNRDTRQQRYESSLAEWESRRQAAEAAHAEQHRAFVAAQEEHNRQIRHFIEQYEKGNPAAVRGYLEEVFASSKYPDAFPVEHDAAFETESRTVVVDLALPSQDSLPTVIDYKFKKTSRSGTPVEMKQKEHDDLYDTAMKQAVLRTLAKAIASTGAEVVGGAVVNGWVTYLDKATGTEKTSCVVSVSADRQRVDEINFGLVDPTECLKSLKGLLAGPLSEVAPVQPILQLDTADRRFVESQEVLAELNATTNLAEIGWEEFEHLVRELFEKMFSENGAEVKVTQASSDGGVDAVAFDPDPIRGGKFVIQAKRYTKVVPVSAVRDLYGTMISEGATKGLLVTTAHYGRDSREFVKDKPISLIDGANLVYLLEKYGHKVRIDTKAARANRNRDPLAR